jgi:hypothetical protein
MRLFWPPAILSGGQRLIATLGKVIDREAPLRQGQRYCTEIVEPLDFNL